MGTPARRLALTVGLLAVGAVLVLVAAGQEWVPAAAVGPLSTRVAGRSGADLLPWLPAAGWVALAGAGATVAARGWLRRLLAVMLAGAGATTAVGAGWAVTTADAAWGWPVATAVGGLLVAGAAAVCAVRGAGWPGLGARYERRDGSGSAKAAAGRPDQLWDALDRGEDPTA